MRCRSLLYTPADRPERYTKAWAESVADIVCADLEDAVAPANKAAARQAVFDALALGSKGTALRAVRINAPGTPDAKLDLAILAKARPDVVVIPKVESVSDVTRVRDALSGTGIRLVAILETAKGVLAAKEILASPGLVAVCFGAEDLAADVGMRRSLTSDEVAMARQWVVLHARVANLPALDMITPDFKDRERNLREAAESRAWGFAGKMCIHPNQVDAIHEAFKPTAKELAWAAKIVAAVEQEGVAEGGVVVVDGQMVDVPVIRQARRILADAA